MIQSVLLRALVLGVSGEFLLWKVRSGPGWLLMVVLGGLLSQGLRVRLERPFRPWTLGLWAAAFALAASLMLYDATVVHALGPVLCALTLMLAIHHTVRRGSELEDLSRSVPVDFASSREAVLMAASSSPRISAAGLRGLMLAVPLVGLFGLLFIQADPAYARFLGQASADWEIAAGKILRVFLGSWLAAALLLKAQWADASSQQGPGGGQHDSLTWSTALHSVNLLFVSFLLCQSRYLFAGRAPEGMTLAEYARHGFFELFTATLLVVALVVGVHSAVYNSQGRARAGRAALALLLLTLGLVVSSLLRMNLYISHFGLTLTRAYVLATLLGIVATLFLCGWALQGWRSPGWLQARLLLLGMLSLSGVGLSNIELWVARVNLSRADVDYAYLAQLSCDVAPALNPTEPNQAEVLRKLQLRAQSQSADWRAWTWSRSRLL